MASYMLTPGYLLEHPHHGLVAIVFGEVDFIDSPEHVYTIDFHSCWVQDHQGNLHKLEDGCGATSPTCG